MSTIDAPDRAGGESWAGRIPGGPVRLLILQAPYYEQVVGGMRQAAQRILTEAGIGHETVDVAGAFELPAALRMALMQQAQQYDGVLILGCVVRGDTDHYDHICRETCAGVMAITAETGAAVGFGLLTVHSLQQALDRSADDRMNKGAEAAHALLGQVALRRRWGLG